MYDQLLDATIQHLQDLKSRGVRFVEVTPTTLAALGQPLPAAPARGPAIHPIPTPRGAGRPLAQSPAPPVRPVEGRPVAEPAPALSLPRETPVAAAPGAISPDAKAAAFADLRQRVVACVKCPHLVSSRKNVVFGVGSLDAELMLIGEAPGADEDEQGEPFVGMAGQLLTKIIQAMGFERSDIFIANVLKCRPDMPPGKSGNRKPKPAEMAACLPWLGEQIALIKPRVIVALGATATEGLLGETSPLRDLRGRWLEFQGIPVMVTYHPAYLLRNQSLSEKRKVWEDMLLVLEKLEKKITAKQRAFFTKPA